MGQEEEFAIIPFGGILNIIELSEFEPHMLSMAFHFYFMMIRSVLLVIPIKPLLHWFLKTWFIDKTEPFIEE